MPFGLEGPPTHQTLFCPTHTTVSPPRAPLRGAGRVHTIFSVILWVAAALAFFAEWSVPGQGMAKIGYAIVMVILVSGVFSFWQEFRVEQSLAALRKLLPQQISVLREGKVSRMLAEELVPGDIVVFAQGDNIPADCRLIEAFDVRVDNAAITGESLPQARNAGPSDATELIQSKNILLAGTAIVSGQARAVVFATGMHTEFGKIAHLVQTAGDEISPLRREIAHLSRPTACLAVLLGLLFFAELVQVFVRPPYDYLDDIVQLRERQVLGDEDAPPNRRAQASQADSQLEDGDRRLRIEGHEHIVGG